MVNDAPAGCEAAVAIPSPPGARPLLRYGVSQADRDRADLTIDPQSEFRLTEGANEFRDRLPPMSLTVYTTYRLAHGDPGILDE